ncbi:spore germination protein [Desertibacillus haloalkaliphilus]|uniref:spore germination protein n=1 Tax=Desertibacillus haloalkaliphilus TaxID=1328930 RepID=UPI0028A64CE8|nr:spore germination protein [Desertibacillus haloalkaliphilus]
MKNKTNLEKKLKDCSDVVFRKLKIGPKYAYLIFIDGLVDTASLEFHAIHELYEYEGKDVTIATIEEQLVSIAEISKKTFIEDIVDEVVSGNTALVVDGINEAILFEANGFETRGITEPETESSIRGPREGFNENLATSIALLRRKLRTKNLKYLNRKVGTETQTKLVVAYLDGLASQELVDEVQRRLDRIEIDGVLESGYIEELIEDNPSSLFPQIQITERPDTVAANLLEGRVAILIDGTPFAMVMPVTFWQLFQASEDYYSRFYISIFLRWVRFIFLSVAIFLPAVYIALTTFHYEMIPTKLLFTFAASREAIPFPAFVEAILMELAFEALREAGVRLPKTIGQAVSILGALVIGTAAVEAGIVSAPMVIVVSLTGIASFTIPRFNVAISIRLLRFPMMILAAIFGLFGIIIGTVFLLTHLCKLRSFGVPYLAPLAPLSVNELKDVFIRTPWWAMEKRPKHIVANNMKRESVNLKPSPDTNDN